MGKERERSRLKYLVLTLLLINFLFVVNAGDTVVNLATDIKDFFIETSLENNARYSSINKFGENTVVGNSFEDIQSQGGTLTFLTSAEKINFISSDTTNDIISGNNARSIEIIGLDENFTEISEIVNLSTIEINTTQNFIRVYRLRVHEVGVYGNTNAGTITGTAESGSVQIEIPTGLGQSQTTHYTIPQGKKGVLKSIKSSIDTTKIIDLDLLVRDNADDTSTNIKPIRHIERWHGITDGFSSEMFGNKVFDEKTDIWFQGKTSVGNSQVEINYDLILYDK